MFSLAPDYTAPTGTTVASYHIDRLGMIPVLTARLSETVPTGETNVFGHPTLVRAMGGREWQIELSAAVPEQLARMQQMLGTVMFTVVKNALIALGHPEITDADIMATVSQIEDIDSVIATQIEAIEEDRRTGVASVTVYGNAPAVTAAS